MTVEEWHKSKIGNPYDQWMIYRVSDGETIVTSCEGIEVATLIEAAPKLLASLQECIRAYEQHRDAQPTGHLWPSPNHIHNARRVIADIERPSC